MDYLDIAARLIISIVALKAIIFGQWWPWQKQCVNCGGKRGI